MNIQPFHEALAALSRCPVCGAKSLINKPTKYRGNARFECGAVFSVSSVLHAIIALEPCPRGSEVQADLLTAGVAGGAA